jgi:8-oxo-dGTP pyrophosphatase MutT (NUDIX family)
VGLFLFCYHDQVKQSFFDVVDEDDRPLEKSASFDEVHQKGLWHRGVHVIIYTLEGEIVMQKRAISLSYHPGLIEISAGGGVDAGETPEQAIVREIREELGLHVSQKELRFIGKTKYNHRTKLLLSRVFIYSYTVCLPKERIRLTVDPEETSMAFLITERKLRRALRRHRIKKLGRVSGEYAYWRYLLDAMRRARAGDRLNS